MSAFPQAPPATERHLSPLPPLFTLDATEEGETFLIRVRGELDLSQRPQLDRALTEAEASGARWILLDLEELTFIDASGLHTLLTASHRSATNGSRLRLTRGRGEVAAMFRLTALDQTLPFRAHG